MENKNKNVFELLIKNYNSISIVKNRTKQNNNNNNKHISPDSKIKIGF